jgi:5-methylcytosine-specific restriction endonuclease McrA
VLPRSRGGANSWENTVAACGRCNQRKGDRTPAEARMPLRSTPKAPGWADLAAR